MSPCPWLYPFSFPITFFQLQARRCGQVLRGVLQSSLRSMLCASAVGFWVISTSGKLWNSPSLRYWVAKCCCLFLTLPQIRRMLFKRAYASLTLHSSWWISWSAVLPLDASSVTEKLWNGVLLHKKIVVLTWRHMKSFFPSFFLAFWKPHF